MSLPPLQWPATPPREFVEAAPPSGATLLTYMEGKRECSWDDGGREEQRSWDLRGEELYTYVGRVCT